MNIKISKNSHSCAACGNDFQHEQELTSVVKVAEGVLNRQDFCRDCWDAEQSKDAYSVWSMVYHDAKVENQEPPEVFSPLRQLFYEAAEEESRIEMAKAFLAAGLLRRQKVFRLIKESDESDGDVRITLYTDRIGNRLIEVPDPQFTYAEMDQARILLIERLQVLEKAAAGTPEGETPEASAPVEATEVPEESGRDADDVEAGEEAEEEFEDDNIEDDDEDDDEDEDDEDEDDEDEDDEDEDDEDEDDEDEDDEDEDDDDEEEDEDDDEDDNEDGEDDDEDDNEDGEDVVGRNAITSEHEEKEVNIMKSALSDSGSATRMVLGRVAFANEEVLHAQA